MSSPQFASKRGELMKHTITVLLLAMAVLAPAQTQKNEPAEGTNATAKALINLENKWVGALVKSDTATLDSIFADTYVDTDEHSHRSDKQGVLSVLKSGGLKIESIKLSDMKVFDYGDAAVVTGSASQAGNFKGESLTAAIIFTDTFVRENGKWKAVASHRSPAA
jgi:ketosteroid isomerase-like protein